MPENLADALLATADVCNWLGRHNEGNALILLSRLLRVRKIKTLVDLDLFVIEEEMGAKP